MEDLNYFSIIKEWLQNTDVDFFKLTNNKLFTCNYNFILSEKSILLKDEEQNKVNDNIYLFTQFYIDQNIDRQKEITKTLKYNCINNSISKIYLMNEREYSLEELGLEKCDNYNKIEQIIINKRLEFIDIDDAIIDRTPEAAPFLGLGISFAPEKKRTNAGLTI